MAAVIQFIEGNLMKKHIILLAMLVGGAGSATAACPGSGYLNGNAVSSLLSGNTACSPANCTVAGGNCQWQEFHQGTGSGTLIEQHSGTAVDPQETVGTWIVETTGPNNGQITHTYNGGGGSFPYRVNTNSPNQYSFCGPNGEFTFSVKLGPGPC